MRESSNGNGWVRIIGLVAVLLGLLSGGLFAAGRIVARLELHEKRTDEHATQLRELDTRVDWLEGRRPRGWQEGPP